MEIKLTLKYYYLYVYKTMKLWWKWLWKDPLEPRYDLIQMWNLGTNTWNKYVDWKGRESNSSAITVNDVDMRDIERITKHEHRDVMTSIRYKSDNGDYWKSSHETMNDGFGDCEDQAILTYKRIINRYGFRNNCFICLIPGHAFCVVKQGKNFWMFDNGNKTMRPEKMHEVLPYYKIKPGVMFNLDGFYRVEERNI